LVFGALASRAPHHGSAAQGGLLATRNTAPQRQLDEERARATGRYNALHELTITQLNAIDLLAGGKTDKEVAGSLEVHRVTVARWRLYHPGFQAALNARRAALWATYQERMRALHGQAIDAISEELRSPGPLRWKLALEVIKYTGFGTPILSAVGPTDPEEIVEDACQANRQRGLTSERLSEEERSAMADELLRRANELPRPDADPEVPADPQSTSHTTDD